MTGDLQDFKDNSTDIEKEILSKEPKSDAYFATIDLLSGDESAYHIVDSNKEDIIDILKKIANDPKFSTKDKIQLMSQSWRINYRQKPPTIEEFLTPEWIGDSAESLYPHIRKILTEFWAPDSKYRHLILASGIRTGKSTLSSINSLFVTTNLWCMRNPKKFFGLAKMSSIVFMMISFTMEKAQQVLFQPFMQILSSSDKFRRVKFEERLDLYQAENPDVICWTTAGRMGRLQFYNDLHYVIASDPAQLLGLNVISAILSEISFFVDRGFGPDYIWRIYQDSVARIRGTFGNKYFSGTTLDSSPNDIVLSPIDKYIFSGEAAKDPENYIFTGPQWEFRPELNPIWLKTGETFPVFRGSESEPAKLLEPEEVSLYNPSEVYNVPIDQLKLFKLDVLKNVKDVCGWPAGAKGMLVRDDSIIENMFVDNLKNIYSYIYAPEDKLPNHLIWDVVYKTFWKPYDKGYEFYRSPSEKRYLHVDQSESGDMASLSMVHPETDAKSGTMVIIVDFTIVISPQKSRINLDAIRYFIQDLVEKGRIHIDFVSFDQYQSASAIQYLKRREIKTEKLSVDASMNPYYTLISYMSAGKLKCGKNIILKNNIKALHESETMHGHKKIDHLKGKITYEDGGDWNTSSMGKFAKDCSDGLCGAVWNCIQHFNSVPRYVWEEDLMRSDQQTVIQNKKKKVLDNIRKKYGIDTSGIGG